MPKRTTPLDLERRGNHPITDKQRGIFLEHVAKTANITAACTIAGFSRTCAYEMRENMPDFKAAWDDALVQATDSLKGEARRRAMDGVLEPVVSMGKVVYTVSASGKAEPLMLRKYSDALLIFLLKAHDRPFFDPPTPAPGAGAEVPADLKPDPEPIPDEPGPDKPVS